MLENATYMLKALFDPETAMPTGMMARQAFSWICERVEAKLQRSALRRISASVAPVSFCVPIDTPACGASSSAR